MQTIVTRNGVEIGTDAARQFVTRCKAHNTIEVWPTGAMAVFAARPANMADWCDGCARAAKVKRLSPARLRPAS